MKLGRQRRTGAARAPIRRVYLVDAALLVLCVALGSAASDSAAPVEDRAAGMVASEDTERADRPNPTARERAAREPTSSEPARARAPTLGPNPSRRTVRTRIEKTDPTRWLEGYGKVEIRHRTAD